MSRRKSLLTESSLFSIVTFLALLFAIFLAITINNYQKTYISDASEFAQKLSISLPTETVEAGKEIKLVLSAIKPTQNDWIGLYKTSTSDESLIHAKYIKECNVQAAAGDVIVGECTFPSTVVPGEYEFRMFRGTLKLYHSKTFTIRDVTY